MCPLSNALRSDLHVQVSAAQRGARIHLLLLSGNNQRPFFFSVLSDFWQSHIPLLQRRYCFGVLWAGGEGQDVASLIFFPGSRFPSSRTAPSRHFDSLFLIEISALQLTSEEM